MKGTYLVLTCVALIFAVDGALAECQMTQITSVPMKKSEIEVPTVPVSINGTEAQFLISTYPQTSIITYKAADKLRLKVKPITNRSVAFDGMLLDSRTVIDTFSVGSAVANGVLMYAAYLPRIPDSIAGTLSFASMQPSDVEIDYGNKRLNLYSVSDDCHGADVVYWTSEAIAALPFELTSSKLARDYIAVSHLLQIEADLDGQKLTALVLPNFPLVGMDIWSARKIFGRTEIGRDLVEIPRPPGLTIAPDRTKFYRHQFKRLTLEGIAIENPEIVLISTNAEPLLYLGDPLLRAFHVYIAYSQNTLYLTEASAN